VDTMYCCFFFSSRRRHTRSKRDWSSDVCSSDLLDLRSSPVLIPIAQAIVAMPLVVRTVLPVLRAIDPRQRQVAGVLGASPLRVLASVDGPYLVRSLGLAIGFAFAVSLGEFGATKIGRAHV